MSLRALQGYEEALGPKHTSTLDTVNKLGLLYKDQGKLKEAEAMYLRALQGKEDAFDTEAIARYKPGLNTMWSLGKLYRALEDFTQAEAMYTRAFDDLFGPSCMQSRTLRSALTLLDPPKGNIN